MKLKEKLAEDRFNQVLPTPITGRFHTPQEAKNVFLYAYQCGFDQAKEMVLEVAQEEEHFLLKNLGEEELEDTGTYLGPV